MSEIYSVYDAKARFSEVIRKVREGKTVLVSYHGETVAEIRPIGGAEDELGRRLRMLEGLGVLVGGDDPVSLQPVVSRAGALERFLADRDE
ncbi:MAG: type II toxin-antitoxin system prevent-host-death family antitoxin [Gemmatimonadota bacterium]|nr:type II toxin-antitoxin system prevent-host-death family antitoxin [Gemmatimonadota bacterium]